jgi:hypothetical protein
MISLLLSQLRPKLLILGKGVAEAEIEIGDVKLQLN